MKVVAVVQARMGSSRLPGKVLKSFNDRPAIGLLLDRLERSKLLDEIVVATSTGRLDDTLVAYLENRGQVLVRGSENDVLSRYNLAAQVSSADIVVRITGDCPLVDASIVDAAIAKFQDMDVDYVSNINLPTFPDGLDVEVFSASVLRDAHEKATKQSDREHVTPYIRESDAFSTAGFAHSEDLSDLRFTLDTQADFEFLTAVFDHFVDDMFVPWEVVVEFVKKNPKISEINQQAVRNEGASLGSGQKLWKRAKEIIPGGNMLLSKRSEMFLPEAWPSYFSKTDGCRVWDLDGKEYIDCGLMGAGTNTLGYSDPVVDEAVIDVVKAGNMSSLNAPEEVALAEALIALNPWADMARFARSGGEANAISVRIGRAASGKDGVAVCGYHGWHDWYLSANLADKGNLDGHLMPGLSPAGVPRGLKGHTFPFEYNDFAALEAIVASQSIGVIKMEVQRSDPPKDNFLGKVRELATRMGIVLIFDECTSGFRETNGGLHKKFGVDPDIAVFGKTLGNGYAVSAVVGNRDVMQAAQSTFISSTFWTERIGSAAGVATLKEILKRKSWIGISEIGETVANDWCKAALDAGVSISVSGLKSLATFSFLDDQALEMKTFFTQEMLKRGYLATTAFYASLAHEPDILAGYRTEMSSVFAAIGAAIKNGDNIEDLLDGPVCHAGFKRLN
jgi:glutamate-1-semialdehyde 2,1-aminomutase